MSRRKILGGLGFTKVKRVFFLKGGGTYKKITGNVVNFIYSFL
jgi:hypothetical protein